MSQPTIPQILAAIHQLNDADRVRILKFALAILEDKRGKRQNRRSRFQQSPINESWRIGQ